MNSVENISHSNLTTKPIPSCRAGDVSRLQNCKFNVNIRTPGGDGNIGWKRKKEVFLLMLREKREVRRAGAGKVNSELSQWDGIQCD